MNNNQAAFYRDAWRRLDGPGALASSSRAARFPWQVSAEHGNYVSWVIFCCNRLKLTTSVRTVTVVTDLAHETRANATLAWTMLMGQS